MKISEEQGLVYNILFWTYGWYFRSTRVQMTATVFSTLCFSKIAAATAPETTGVSDLESNESNFLFEPPPRPSLLEPRPSLLEELLKLRFMVKVMTMEDAIDVV